MARLIHEDTNGFRAAIFTLHKGVTMSGFGGVVAAVVAAYGENSQ
jgi:hypothetical protein